MKSKIIFGLSWFRSPKKVGTVTTSSRRLGTAVAKEVDVAQPGTVVELGGGTGAITGALLAAGLPPENLIVIECDPVLADTCRTTYPHVTVITGDATRLKELLKDYDTGAVHTVVSGIPPLLLTKAEQECLLGAAFDLMGPDGRLVQYTYSPACPVPKDRLKEWGFNARRSAYVWGNLPPASVWTFTADKDDQAAMAA